MHSRHSAGDLLVSSREKGQLKTFLSDNTNGISTHAQPKRFSRNRDCLNDYSASAPLVDYQIHKNQDMYSRIWSWILFSLDFFHFSGMFILGTCLFESGLVHIYPSGAPTLVLYAFSINSLLNLQWKQRILLQWKRVKHFLSIGSNEVGSAETEEEGTNELLNIVTSNERTSSSVELLTEELESKDTLPGVTSNEQTSSSTGSEEYAVILWENGNRDWRRLKGLFRRCRTCSGDATVNQKTFSSWDRHKRTVANKSVHDDQSRCSRARRFLSIILPLAYTIMLYALAKTEGKEIAWWKFVLLYVCGILYGSYQNARMVTDYFGAAIKAHQNHILHFQARLFLREISNSEEAVKQVRLISNKVRALNNKFSLYLKIHFFVVICEAAILIVQWVMLLEYLDTEYTCLFCFTKNGDSSCDLLENEETRIFYLVMGENLIFTFMVALHAYIPVHYAAKLDTSHDRLLEFITNDMQFLNGSPEAHDDSENKSLTQTAAFSQLVKDTKLSMKVCGFPIARKSLVFLVPIVLKLLYYMYVAVRPTRTTPTE